MGEIARRSMRKGSPPASKAPLGALDGLGSTAQACVSRRRRFGKMRVAARIASREHSVGAVESSPAIVSGTNVRARSGSRSQCLPWLAERASPGPRAPPGKQDSIAAPYDHPSVVQGFVSCQKCGYAFSRTSTYTTARKLHYYKCIGSDGWRKLGGPVCDNRVGATGLLDQIVWAEVIRLLEDPNLIQQELDRRLIAARSSDPTRKREQSLQRELIQVGKGIERLLTAYQKGSCRSKLRGRMPALRQREQTLRAELQAITDQSTIAPRSCAWPRPSRHSSGACAAKPKRWTSRTPADRASCHQGHPHW